MNRIIEQLKKIAAVPGYNYIPAQQGMQDIYNYLEEDIVNNVMLNSNDSMCKYGLHINFYKEVPNSEGDEKSGYYGVLIDDDTNNNYYCEVYVKVAKDEYEKIDNNHQYIIAATLYEDKRAIDQTSEFTTNMPSYAELYNFAITFVSQKLGKDIIVYNEFY